MKLTLFLLLFSSVVHSKVTGPDHSDPNPGKPSMPSVSVPSLNFEGSVISETLSFTENYFDKKIVHRPGVEVNQYLGDLTTSINIPLPKAFHSLKYLSLKYNSSQILNTGYGIGMSLNLPKLSIDKNSSELKILHSEIPGELLPKSNLGLMAGKRIEQICGAISFKCDEAQKEYFLNQSGEDSSLYLKLTLGKFVKYAQVKTDGETWIFDNEGFPERVLATKQKGMKISFDNGILQKLEDLDSLWQVYLNYNESSSEVRSYNGVFRNSITGLESISISQGSTKLLYEFNYSGEYLIRFSEKNSLKNLFQGDYEFPNNNSYEMVQEGSSINFQKDSTLVYEADLNKLKWQKNNPDNIEFQVDLNGDFYMDKVVFNQKEIINSANAIAKEYIPVRQNNMYRPAKGPQDLENRLNSIDQKIRTYIAVNENGTLVYKEDQTLSVPVNEIKFVKFKVSEIVRKYESEIATFDIVDYSIDSKLVSIPKFIDLDGNGKKDILFCDYQEDLKFLDRSLAGMGLDGQKQNLTAVAYFDFYKNQKINPLVSKGQSQSIYMVYPDRKKLQLLAAQNFDERSRLLNSSMMKKIPANGSFSCNQLSFPLDYNNDGVADLLTGNQIALFSDSGAVKNISLSNEELKKIINPPREDLDFEKNQVDLMDLKNDGKLDFVSTFGSYVDHKDRSLVYLRNSIAYKVKRKVPVKLLVKETVTFGGLATIDYKYVAGSSLVDSISYTPSLKKNEKNRKQPSFKKSYEYTGAKFHDQFNILLGHSSSVEKITRENVVTTVKETEFDQDFQNGPIFYLTRARKNGRVLKQTILDDSANWTMINKNTYAESSALGQDRLYSYLKTQEKTTKGEGKASIVTSNELSSPINNITFLEKVNKSISTTDQVVKNSKFTLDIDSYQVLKSAEQIKDQNGNRLKPDSSYFYNSDAELTQAFLEGISINFSYDKYGRLVSSVDQRGKYLNFNYFKATPLITERRQNGSGSNYEYYDVTNFLKTSKKDKTTEISYEWSTDELLLSAERDGTKLYNLQYIPETNIFKINIGDIERNYYVDGFGRVVQIDRLTDDGIVVDKQVTLDENDQKIKEWIPGSENATISYKYDSLGRETLKHLSGKLRLESAVFNFKTITSYDYNGTQTISEDLASNIKDYKTFVQNERGDVINLKSLSENMTFFLNPNGKILGIRELGAKYNYDLYSNVASTEANSSLVTWEKMEQKYNVIENRLESISGTLVKDAEDQIVLAKNSSLYSPVIQKNQYEKGLVLETNLILKEANLKTSYTYNEEDLLSQIKIGEFSKEYKFDQYFRPVKETLNINKGQLVIEHNFSKGQLNSIAPYITKIFYDERSEVSEIEYQNGVRATFEYDVFKKPIYHNWNVGADNYGIEYNTTLLQGEQSKIYVNAEFVGLKQKNKNYQYDDRIHLKKKPRLAATSKGVSFTGSNLKQVENFAFSYENDLLIRIDYKGTKTFNNFVSMDKKWQGTCPLNFKTLEECFIKINADEFISQGDYIKAIKVGDKIAGILYNEKFYPAIIDHLGSVVALVDPDGNKLAFERVYNEWGEKEQVFGDKELEKNIPWAFAGLIQHPFFNGEILQSETRVYIPSLGLWSSADDLVKWNPSELASASGNWDPLLYASGDPVNKSDPSGYVSINNVMTMSEDGAGGGVSLRDASEASRGISIREAKANDAKMTKIGIGVGIAAGAVAGPSIVAGAQQAGGIIVAGAQKIGTTVVIAASNNPRIAKAVEAAAVGLIEGFVGARYGKGESTAPGNWTQLTNYFIKKGGQEVGKYTRENYDN